MNIQELRNKFEDLGNIEVFKDTKWEESAKIDIEENVKLSIQFAIEMLIALVKKRNYYRGEDLYLLDIKYVEDKIEELKKYL